VARSIGEVYVTVEANTRKFTRESQVAARRAGTVAGRTWQQRFESGRDRSANWNRWSAKALKQAGKTGVLAGSGYGASFKRAASRFIDNLIGSNRAAAAAEWRAYGDAMGRLYSRAFAAAVTIRLNTAALAKSLPSIVANARFAGRLWSREFRVRASDALKRLIGSNGPAAAAEFRAFGAAVGRVWNRGVAATANVRRALTSGLSVVTPRFAALGARVGRVFSSAFRSMVTVDPNTPKAAAQAIGAGLRHGRLYARAFNRMAKRLNPSNWFRGMDRTVRMVMIGLVTLGGPAMALVSSLTAGTLAFASAMGVAAAAAAVTLAPALGALVAAGGALVVGFTALAKPTGQIKTFVDTVKAEWKRMQKAVAEPLFAGLAKPMTTAMKAVTPLLVTMNKAINAVAKDLLALFSGLNFDALGAVFTSIIAPLGQAMGSFITGFSALMEVAGPAAQQLATRFAQVGAAFSTWFQDEGNREKFAGFLATGLDLLTRFGNVIKPLGSALLDVVEVATSGPAQVLLDLFSNLAQQFKDFTSSVEGRQALQKFFDSIALAGQALKPVIEGLAEGIKRMVTPAAAKALIGVGEALGALLPLVGSLFNALAESGILDAFTGAIVQLAEVVAKPGGLLEAMGRLAESFGGALAAVLPSLVGLLDGLFKVIIPIADAVGALLLPVMDALAPVIDTVAQVLGDLAPKFGKLMDGLVLLITPLLEPLAEVFLAVADNLDLLNPLMDLVVSILTDLGPVLIPLVKLFGELLKGVATGITLFGTIAGKIIEVATGFADWLLKSEPVKKAMEVISGAIDGVTSAIQTAVGWIKDLIGWLGDIKMPDVIGNIQSAIGGIKLPWMASGGIARGPMIAGIGEAGPEAVIPLTRPLSQVDPSVRQMAAMLRGQTVVQQTKVTGAPTGPSRTNIVYVQPTQADPEAVAYSVANRLAAQAG
jgi:phage-related protein